MSSARRPRSTENGLREYPIPDSDWPAVRYAPLAGMAEIDIPGCDPGCEHEWGEEIMQNQRGSVGSKSTLGGGLQAGGAGRPQTASEGAWCQKCGGWRGQLGREPTIEMYVGHLVHVLRLVKRVLRDDGTLWLNLGDSSMASAKGTPVQDYMEPTWGTVNTPMARRCASPKTQWNYATTLPRRRLPTCYPS